MLLDVEGVSYSKKEQAKKDLHYLDHSLDSLPFEWLEACLSKLINRCYYCFLVRGSQKSLESLIGDENLGRIQFLYSEDF